jgi:Phytanoyl-CoA dioxygenase (PhyH)
MEGPFHREAIAWPGMTNRLPSPQGRPRAAPYGALTESERYDFDRNGFLIRRNALSSAEVHEIQRAVDRLNYPPPGPTISSQRFNGFLSSDPSIRSLMDHDAVLEPIVEMCGDTARLDHFYGIAMAPGTSGLGLHGGGTPHDPAQFYRVINGQMYNGLVAVQWALVDHPPGDGGFCCIPGSHRSNFELPDVVDPEWVIDVSLNAGDLLIFTEALTHGTSTWNASYARISLFFKYAPGHLAWGNDYGRELGDPTLRSLLTDRQTRLVQSPSVWPHPTILAEQ